MKKVVKIALWGVSVVLIYLVYESISAPARFQKIKKTRYVAAIERLKDIKMSQEAYRTVNGDFAENFEKLKNFVDIANFVLTQQRDTSWMEYDPIYKIDVPKEDIVIDTLGYVSVKDSLFGSSMRYQKMDVIPIRKKNKVEEGGKIEMKSALLEQSGYQVSVFEAKIPKKVVLYDQPNDLVTLEKSVIGVGEIDGEYIEVGSLDKVSTSGNWPAIYDKREQ